MAIRDRTNEFMAVAEAAARRRHPAVHSSSNSPSQPLLVGNDLQSHSAIEEMRQRRIEKKRKKQGNAPAPASVSVMAEAGRVGRDIAAVSAKLERLTKLAKERSLFDEDTRMAEIQQLTVVINDDIKNLNEQIADMQRRARIPANPSSAAQAERHVATVLDSLKTKLKGATKKFSDVLELRTQSLKTQQKNREAFTGHATHRLGKLPSGVAAGSTVQPPPGSSPGLTHRVGSAVPSFGDSPLLGSPSVAIQMPPESGGMLVQTQAVAVQDRSEVVRGIESTIVELQGIFQQLATLVAEQGEMIERIDSNVEDSVSNVDQAQTELLRYLRTVSSNRGLMLKLFAVLAVFVVIFIMLM